MIRDVPCRRSDVFPFELFRPGPDESTSLLGQYLHTFYPNDFDVVDIDLVVRKSSTGIVRFFEDKLPRQGISASQQRVLPILAFVADYAVRWGHWSPSSGVFVVHWSSTTDGCAHLSDHSAAVTVDWVRSGRGVRWDSVDTTVSECAPLFRGEPVDLVEFFHVDHSTRRAG